jgi:hypothetical protein
MIVKDKCRGRPLFLRDHEITLPGGRVAGGIAWENPPMPSEPHGPGPGPADEDDFDRQLRELADGGTGARFREPSAAERAARQTRRSRQRRESRKARQLREPVPEPGRPVQRRPAKARAAARLRRGRLGRFTEAMLRSRPVLIVVLVLAALVAVSIGLAWLSQH